MTGSGSPITVRCPECHYLGTHLGTCSWSQMRSGRVWTFQAVAICDAFADLDTVESATRSSEGSAA